MVAVPFALGSSFGTTGPQPSSRSVNALSRLSAPEQIAERLQAAYARDARF
ncbi:hypothetical protein [Streptomyces flaveus]|uniref:hypothetical protein n=1 Tax=Streptomyces flaveus TaxID=66370 RepID=UPI00331AF6CA